MPTNYHRKVNQDLLDSYACKKKPEVINTVYSIFLQVYTYINENISERALYNIDPTKITIVYHYKDVNAVNPPYLHQNNTNHLSSIQMCDFKLLNYEFMKDFCYSKNKFFRYDEKKFSEYCVDKTALMQGAENVLKMAIAKSFFRTVEKFESFIQQSMYILPESELLTNCLDEQYPYCICSSEFLEFITWLI